MDLQKMGSPRYLCGENSAFENLGNWPKMTQSGREKTQSARNNETDLMVPPETNLNQQNRPHIENVRYLGNSKSDYKPWREPCANKAER